MGAFVPFVQEIPEIERNLYDFGFENAAAGIFRLLKSYLSFFFLDIVHFSSWRRDCCSASAILLLFMQSSNRLSSEYCE